MVYIVKSTNLQGNVTYYRAKNRTQAMLYKDNALRSVEILSSYEFLSKLPEVPVKGFKIKNEDFLLD